MAKNDMQVALDSITKLLGNSKCKVSVYSKRKDEALEVIPFGVQSVDDASSVGGIGRGKLVELFGLESSGKSWLTLKLIGSCQKMGLKAGLLDVEHSFMPEWAAKNGVDVPNLLYGDDFDNGEDCLEHARAIVQAGVIDLLVIDSTAALIPKAELEGRLDKDGMAVHARMMSKAVKQIKDYGEKTNTSVVFINQVRTSPGVMFGNPETTPGGKALKFYSDQRIRVNRVEVIKTPGQDGDKLPSGIKSKVKFEKNRIGKPFGEAEFEIYFNPGDNSPTVKLVDLAYRKPLSLVKRRKGEDGLMHFMWGTGKDVEETECTSTPMFAEWLVMNDYVIDLLDMVEAKAKEINIPLPEEVQAIRNEIASQPIEAPEEK